VTLEAQWKPEWKSFKSRFKYWESHWSVLFVAVNSRHTVLKTGKHVWKSMSWWTVGPATGWQMSVKFGCRHVQWFGGAGKPEWTCSGLCTSELPNCMWSAARLATDAAGAVMASHGITSTPGVQSELHCSELATVSGWCQSVHHEAQRCSSRSWTGSGYMLTSVLTPSIEDVWCDG